MLEIGNVPMKPQIDRYRAQHPESINHLSVRMVKSARQTPPAMFPAEANYNGDELQLRHGYRDAITRLLISNPGITARTISESLTIPLQNVNSVLFTHADRFYSAPCVDSSPVWYCSISVESGLCLNCQLALLELVSPAISTPTGPDQFDLIFENPEFDPFVTNRFVKHDDGCRPTPAVSAASPSNPFGLYTWQQEALSAWRANGQRGIVDAVTGAGKTRVGIVAISEALERGMKTLVLVPTITLLHQWCDDILELLPNVALGRVGDGFEDRFDGHDVIVAVMASARSRRFSLRGAEGLLIADECHRSAAPQNKKALTAAFSWRLGLSATHERLDEAHISVLLPYFHRVVFTLGYERAMADGVIAPVNVTFVGVEFSDEEKECYIQLQRELSSLRRKLVGQMGCRPDPFPAFMDDVLRLCARGTSEERRAARRWLKAWNNKKELLARTPAKLEALALIEDKIRTANRSLFFTQTIGSAQDIAFALRALGFRVELHHSDLSALERQSNLQDFTGGAIDCLVTVQTLEEGVDVPDADLAVIVAASKQRRQMIQRMGRVLRRKSDGRDAEFAILFVEMTDEDPRLGAHATFVEELMAVAQSSKINIGGEYLLPELSTANA